jgi:hypothetical protein
MTEEAKEEWECARCHEPVAVSLTCGNCAEDCGTYDGSDYIEEDGLWYVRAGTGKYEGEHMRLVRCTECKGSAIEEDYTSALCDYCQHMMDKDD